MIHPPFCPAAQLKRECAPVGIHAHHEPTIGFADDSPVKIQVQTAEQTDRILLAAFDEAVTDLPAEQCKAFGEFLTRLLAFPIGTRLAPNTERQIGLRCLAMAWTLKPELLGGLSLRQIAKRLRVSPGLLANFSGAFSREFDYHASHQAQGHSRAERRGITESNNNPRDENDDITTHQN